MGPDSWDGHESGRDASFRNTRRLRRPELMRDALTAAALVLWLLSLTVIAVAQNQPLVFEVASVKRNPGCETQPRSAQSVSAGRLNLECITLQDLIENAYGVWADAALSRMCYETRRRICIVPR
jgi:hypothetical protein